MKVRMKSITYAMKAKEILKEKGIDAEVVKDLRLSGGGCVYAVSFGDRYRKISIELLMQGCLELHSTESWEKLK